MNTLAANIAELTGSRIDLGNFLGWANWYEASLDMGSGITTCYIQPVKVVTWMTAILILRMTTALIGPTLPACKPVSPLLRVTKLRGKRALEGTGGCAATDDLV